MLLSVLYDPHTPQIKTRIKSRTANGQWQHYRDINKNVGFNGYVSCNANMNICIYSSVPSYKN